MRKMKWIIICLAVALCYPLAKGIKTLRGYTPAQPIARKSHETVVDDPKKHPESTPLEKAAKRCTEFVREYPNMEVIRADCRTNDTQWGTHAYPITVVVTVRMQGPHGPKKGLAVFGCDSDGAIVQIHAMPDYFDIAKSAL